MAPPGRRLKFAITVLVSQLLLIALALAWAIHMILIAANGAVYFVENNPAILWTEVVITVIISLFGVAVFTLQVYRLGERRRSDERSEDRRNQQNSL
jgi:membrane protein implicated in regulation of membrane protease activity